MQERVADYFLQTVVPLMTRRLPGLAARATIQVIGSYALGIADHHSDLDAVIYLPDDLWQASGGDLQLLLDRELPRFGADTTHPDVVVWPMKWLGKLLGFLEGEGAPWEEETIERLHEVQHCLVLSDPDHVFERLKAATSPSRFPDWLWQKRIIDLLRDLYQDHLLEYRQVIARRLPTEEAIVLGIMLKKGMQLGFLIARQYYPWQTHLRWAYERLPPPADRVLQHTDRLTTGKVNGAGKLEEMGAILELYRLHLVKNRIVPGLKLDGVDMDVGSELEWAMRFKAWENPRWRLRVRDLRERAVAAGESPDKWWIWSLWGK